ncbi:unnamed protein product [Cuscuta campestris]|uniref:Water stress and hypersensitive response domain-containing protein n=2 Tax=Cuscuta sect. Cleistogrammica TaxID=1824901 RepID=A0A484M0J9_9ASTE|nr:hypothetical protein DM860_004651 [Cuscuta australis]VFQ82049.1 unnamed protein product [Cuscuta campestris]
MDLVEKAKNYVGEKLASMPMPEASISDVDIKGISVDGISYHVKVDVKNPYSSSIPICEIRYVLNSADREIASGTIPDPGSLKGNETTVVDVPVKVPHSVLLSLGRDIGRDWDIDYLLNLTLVVDLPLIGNISIPLSRRGEIKLPTLSDFWNKSGDS